MEYVAGIENVVSMPPGVTPINDLKSQKRANKTLSKAVSLHLEGKLESAARLLTKAIEDGEKEPSLYSALGHIQYEMRDYEAAARTYSQLSDIDPHHRTAHFNLAAMFTKMKATERARRYAEMLCELQPDSPVATEALATPASQDGDYLTAARHCRTLCEAAPDRFENWFNLGVAHHKMGNYDK